LRYSIPTYDASGRRLRDYTEASLLTLEQAGRVVIRRRRDGSVRKASFVDLHPVRRSACAGQRYSYRERIGELSVWRLKPLPASPHPFTAVIRGIGA
jgi:hypothetical protein